jgi:hypothetical protein
MDEILPTFRRQRLLDVRSNACPGSQKLPRYYKLLLPGQFPINFHDVQSERETLRPNGVLFREVSLIKNSKLRIKNLFLRVWKPETDIGEMTVEKIKR